VNRSLEPEIIDNPALPEQLMDLVYADLARTHRSLGNTRALVSARTDTRRANFAGRRGARSAAQLRYSDCRLRCTPSGRRRTGGANSERRPLLRAVPDSRLISSTRRAGGPFLSGRGLLMIELRRRLGVDVVGVELRDPWCGIHYRWHCFGCLWRRSFIRSMPRTAPTRSGAHSRRPSWARWSRGRCINLARHFGITSIRSAYDRSWRHYLLNFVHDD